MLIAVIAVIAGVAGCGGRAASPTATTGDGALRSIAATLPSAPPAIATACSALARSRTLAVLCPTRLPNGRWAVNHKTLRNGRCAYLLDLNTRPFGQNIPFHALAGGRCGAWPLTTRGGHWPAVPTLVNDLGLIGAKPLRPGQPGTTSPILVPPRVLRRVDIGGHSGLLLQEAAYPNGGVHGGHVAAIWNQGADGYVLSLHFTEQPRASIASWRRMVIDAASAMSLSPEPASLSAGASLSPSAAKVISPRPTPELRRRGAQLSLTSGVPRSVRRACATAVAKSRAVVYCPPLVPTGRTLVDGVDGVLRSRDFRSGFVANFQSRSVKVTRSAPGHWSIAEGDPQTLRRLLHPPAYDPREGSIRQRPLRIGHTSATLWLMPSFRIFHGIYGGHTVISWQCARREYQVSMHGHTNSARTVLIATALADELPATCRR